MYRCVRRGGEIKGQEPGRIKKYKKQGSIVRIGRKILSFSTWKSHNSILSPSCPFRNTFLLCIHRIFLSNSKGGGKKQMKIGELKKEKMYKTQQHQWESNA